MSVKEWFKKYNVSSFSPQLSKILLDCVDDLDKALKSGGDKETCAAEIIKYRDALYAVAFTSHIQQAAVIERLGELVEARSETKR